METCMDVNIISERLLICLADKAYIKEYYQYFDEDIAKYQYPDAFASLQEAEKTLDYFLASMAKGEMLELMILTKDKEFLGSLEVFGWKEAKVEMGLWLKKEAQGKGYGKEAMQAMLSFIKKQHRFTSISFEVDVRNQASQALVHTLPVQEKETKKYITESGKELHLTSFQIELPKEDIDYKIIACDMDETLLTSTHGICDANIKAIQEASAKGVKFVPCTGRGYQSIQQYLKLLGLYDKEHEYVISFNGCALTENKGNKVLFFDGIPFEKVNELFQFGKTKDVCIHIYTDEELYVYHLNEDERARLAAMKVTFIELQDSIDFLKDKRFAKVIYQNTDVPYLQSFAHEMKSFCEGSITIAYSSNRYMELNKEGVSKGITMLKLAERLGAAQSQTMAIGDHYNDVSMLEMAGLAVAPSNAIDDIKAMCDVVTKTDHNEGAVAEAIQTYIIK